MIPFLRALLRIMSKHCLTLIVFGSLFHLASPSPSAWIGPCPSSALGKYLPALPTCLPGPRWLHSTGKATRTKASCRKFNTRGGLRNSMQAMVEKDRIKISLSVITPDDVMPVAAVRCAAFNGGIANPHFMDVRWNLFQTTKKRVELGATVIAARCTEPSLLLLKLLGRSPELISGKDETALQNLGKVGEGNEQDTVIQNWWKSRGGVGPIVGAVDISTHEFERSSMWMRERKGKLDMYLSDMAVHPSFSGLGIGRQLIQSCLDLARQRGYSELHLHVEERNERARSLYEGAGFKHPPQDLVTQDFARVLLFDPRIPTNHMTKVL